MPDLGAVPVATTASTLPPGWMNGAFMEIYVRGYKDSNGDGKIDRYFGLFTYGLCYGNGWNLARNSAISSLNADLNKDSKVTLYEAYVYAKVMAQSHNPNQTAQIWPENSAFVLWGK